MKDSAAFLKSLKDRGYIEHDNTLYPPNQAKHLTLEPIKPKRSNMVKTGWIDDTRNLKNKERIDVFTRLVKQELNLDCWSEFYFSTERLYRFDYAIPEIKLGLEVDGGIWKKGASGHSSGTGIKRDQEKASLAASLGWYLIRVQPSELLTTSTLELINKIKIKSA